MISLEIWLHDVKVGNLTLFSGERILFTFEESYIHLENRPTLSQSFISATGQLLTDIKPTQVKLPPFFSNLLPEGPLREYLAARGNVNPQREFYLLKLLGEDLPGAVYIKGIEEVTPSFSQPLEESQKTHSESFRFSLAGVQLKFSALENKRGHLTIPAKGIGGNWILKLPSLRFPHLPENEWSMLQLAKLIDIPVPEIKLIDLGQVEGIPDFASFSEKTALVIKRFDRDEKGQRIHVEDMAQVYGIYPERKYEKVSYTNIAKMLWIIMGEEAALDFIKRLVFNIFIGNADMHLKNWSLIYRDKRTPELAPAYDFVSTIAYLPDTKMALSLGDKKEMRAIDEALFKRFARKANLPEHLVLEVVLDTAQQILEAWNKYKKDLKLSSLTREIINKHMLMIPLGKKNLS